MPIKLKFTILVSTLMLILIFTVSAFFYYTEKKFLIKELKEKEISAVKQFAASSRESLLVQDELSIFNYANIIKKATPGVVYAMFENKKGFITAHTDPKLLYKTDKTDIGKNALSSKDILIQQSENIFDFAYPVFLKTELKGVVRVGYSKDFMDRNINIVMKSTRYRIFGVALLGLVLGFIGSVILAQTFTRPIDIIAKGAQRIGAGNLSTRIVLKRKDELGFLSEEFNKMAVKLAELDEMKRDFVASVTHELRSPLAATQVFLDIMLKKIKTKDPDFDWEDAILSIKSNTTRLGRYINDLLDVAKIEAGKFDVNLQRMDIVPAIQNIVKLFQPVASEKKIELTFNHDFQSVYIDGDEDRLKQVITNLIGNAMKFTPEGGRITVKAEIGNTKSFNLQLSTPGCIVVSISDTGVGIPKESLNKIFNKFEQVKGTRDQIKGPKGTGLGLAIAKAIVELHGGKIWVESELKKGSIFYFILPEV
ncbi:MAG: HAMP domain-containing sensor histidine kinase [Elusimicrobiota bacterium]